MTSTAMLAKLRALLDESASGFWNDTQLYTYLDSAQSIIIDILLQKQKALKLAQGQNYEIEELKPLIKSNATIDLSALVNYVSLSTITDLMEIYQAIMYNTTSGAELVMNYIPLKDMKLRKLNSYTGHSYDTTAKTGNVYCSLYQGTLISSFTLTFPTSDYNKLLLYYYAQPTTVSGSQNYTLPSNTHEAGILIAVALAKYQDDKKQEGDIYYQQALQQLANL